MLRQTILKHAALVVFFAAAKTLAGDYQVLRLPVSELLPQYTFSDLHVDQGGFLWLSAGKHVYRYDGYRLAQVYVGGDGPNPGSLINTRKLLSGDSTGAVWLVDGANQVKRYDPKTRSFVRQDLFPRESADSNIYSAVGDQDGLLWLLLLNNDIAVYDTSGRHPIDKISTSNYLGDNDHIIDLAPTGEGRAWLLTTTGILLECVLGQRSCSRFDLALAVDQADAADFQEIAFVAPNRLIASSGTRGVFEVHTDTYETKHLQIQLSKNAVNSRDSEVWATGVSPRGEVWLGTVDGLLGPIGRDEPGGHSLVATQEQRLMAMKFEHFDRDKLLAIMSDGISIIRETSFESIGSRRELAGLISTTFTQSTDGTVYIGSIHGLSAFNPSTSHSAPLSERLPDLDLLDSRVMALLADSDGIWIGGYSGGLRHLSNERGRLRQVLDSEKKLSAISQILAIEDDRLLVGTPNHGLLVLSKEGSILDQYAPKAGPTSSGGSFIISMLDARDGSTYVGTENGMYQFALPSRQTPAKEGRASYHLAGEEVYDSLEASDGSIWVGTYQSGLFRSTRQHQDSSLDFKKVETSPALPGNTIHAIEEDDLGMLWLATNKGLVRLEPKTMSITVFDQSDGLVDDEFNVGASLKDRDGFLYFGSAKGFSRFNPRDFVTQRVPPPLRLTELMIRREPVPYDPAYVDIPELVLTHEDHSLDVEFSTMDIISPGRSRYKYRLESFDDDWVDIGTRNSATFTSLPAGEYVLRVIGADSKGVWNYDGITLPVRVLPAPWLTWWAFTLYGLCALLLLALVKRSYDTYLQKNAATAEAREMKITATLAMDDLQDQLQVENRLVANLRRHANDTFDMVDELLSLELEELVAEEADEPMGRARQRLRALKSLEAGVYFHGDLIKVNFRDAIDHSYADIVKAHPHPLAELVLANDCSEELVPVDIAAPLLMLAHELMLNSVLHAFPGVQGVHCIEVAFQPTAQGWLFSLSDAGCGLPESIDPSRPATLGMELVARIVNRLRATIEVDRENGTHYRIEIPA